MCVRCSLKALAAATIVRVRDVLLRAREKKTSAMAGSPGRSFLEAPIQDVARSPLVEGQTLPGLCVFGLLAVIKRRPEGIEAWYNFEKAAKAKGSDGKSLLASNGVHLMQAKVMGKPKSRRVVAPEDVPRFLTVVCGGQESRPALEAADVLETMVARGVDRGRAMDLLAEQVQKLQEKRCATCACPEGTAKRVQSSSCRPSTL